MKAYDKEKIRNFLMGREVDGDCKLDPFALRNYKILLLK